MERFSINSTMIKREDFELVFIDKKITDNPNSFTIQCSLFTPENWEDKEEIPPCMVYLHSYSGSRIEGIGFLDQLLPKYCLCVFDFVGCGLSEGEYVSLGLKESKQTELVIEYLEKEYGFKDLYIWGRSMGAVAALIYAHDNKISNVNGMILDSPFYDAKSMITGIIQKFSNIPAFVIRTGLIPISYSLESNTGYDVLGISPKDLVASCKIPALFLVATDDFISPPELVNVMYSNYGDAYKEFVQTEGEHHTPREDSDIERCLAWLKLSKHFASRRKSSVLQNRESMILINRSSMQNYLPHPKPIGDIVDPLSTSVNLDETDEFDEGEGIKKIRPGIKRLSSSAYSQNK